LSQDCGLNAGFGAYTGEISPMLLKDAGITWTLTGHSERRVGFGLPGETSSVVAGKTAAAIKTGLSVILCIGEQLAEREAGTTMTVCAEQLAPVVAALAQADWASVVVAYGRCHMPICHCHRIT
jgi:triosephosphate isomerase